MAEHDRTYLIRCSQGWRDLVDQAAETAGLNTADWLREAGAAAASVQVGHRAPSAVVDRYRQICARHRPRLSRQEWGLVCDALNGVWLQPAEMACSPSAIAFEVSDACSLSQRHRAHGIEDPRLLLDRLTALSYAEAVALVDVVETWWADPGRGIEALPDEPGVER